MIEAQFGHLQESPDERLICYECGDDFLGLGQHVWFGHGMRASEYKEKYGLNRATGLIAKSTKAKFQRRALDIGLSDLGRPYLEQADPPVHFRGPLRAQAKNNMAHPKSEAGALAIRESNIKRNKGVIPWWTHTPEANEKKRIALSGRPLSEARKRNISKAKRRETCPRGHSMTDAYIKPSGKRRCRECSRVRAKELREERRKTAHGQATV